MTTRNRRVLAAGLLCLAAGLAGCSSDPIEDDGIVCDHIDVDGMVIEGPTGSHASQWLGEVTGGLDVSAGLVQDSLSVVWLDEDSLRITVGAECVDHGLRFSIADTTIAQAVPIAGERWSFRLLGRREGSTTLRARLWHGDHADFTSLEIPVEVGAGPSASAVWIRNGCTVAATWNYNPDRGANVATGPLIVAPGGRLTGLTVEWLGPWDGGDGGTEAGHRAILEPPGTGFRLGWSLADGAIARAEPVSCEAWRFDLVGLAAGSTTLELSLEGEAGTLYRSGAIPIRVEDGPTGQAIPDFYLKRNGITHVIVRNGALVAAACNREANPGRLDVGLGDLSDLIFLKFLDATCDTDDPSSSRDTLVFDFENRCLVEVTGHPIHWGERTFFHLAGREIGQTSMRFTFLRDGIPRWSSPPIAVRVVG
jgi:hypothetical protein